MAVRVNSNAEKLLNIANASAENLYIKTDGSLDEGLELVTHPMTLEYHLNEMPWAELLWFSRCTQSQMNRWAARYGIRLTPSEQMSHAKNSCAGRYTAVNLTNSDTVEIRMFRGTLKLNTLKATLQMVNHLVEVAVAMSDSQVQDMSWFVVGDNPLCVMFYDGFLIYVSTQEILCKAIKKLRLKAPTDILEPKEGEILRIDRAGRITTGAFAPRTSYEHWWRRYSPYYRNYYEDTPTNYDDLFSVAKSFGVTANEVQALLDYGCSEEEIKEMLYDLPLLHEVTGELLYAY